VAKLPARGKESRSGSLVVSGLLAASLCIAIGALADQWLSQPVAPAQRASAPEQAIRSLLPDRAPPRPDPAAAVGAPELPESERAQAEPEPEWPVFALPSPESAAAFEAARELDLDDTVFVPRTEVQAVAGTQPPDAGTNAAQAQAAPASIRDAGAEPAVSSAVADPSLGPTSGAEPTPEREVVPEACGLISCADGYACCNASCGVCVAPGDDCDPTPCERKIQNPVSQLCGRSTCNVGDVCCNPSCGTCVAPGETCSPDPCD